MTTSYETLSIENTVPNIHYIVRLYVTLFSKGHPWPFSSDAIPAIHVYGTLYIEVLISPVLCRGAYSFALL